VTGTSIGRQEKQNQVQASRNGEQEMCKKTAVIKGHIIFVTGGVCIYEMTALMRPTANRKWELD
jgi:hypothetical protein